MKNTLSVKRRTALALFALVLFVAVLGTVLLATMQPAKADVTVGHGNGLVLIDNDLSMKSDTNNRWKASSLQFGTASGGAISDVIKNTTTITNNVEMTYGPENASIALFDVFQEPSRNSNTNDRKIEFIGWSMHKVAGSVYDLQTINNRKALPNLTGITSEGNSNYTFSVKENNLVISDDLWDTTKSFSTSNGAKQAGTLPKDVGVYLVVASFKSYYNYYLGSSTRVDSRVALLTILPKDLTVEWTSTDLGSSWKATYDNEVKEAVATISAKRVGATQTAFTAAELPTPVVSYESTDETPLVSQNGKDYAAATMRYFPLWITTVSRPATSNWLLPTQLKPSQSTNVRLR